MNRFRFIRNISLALISMLAINASADTQYTVRKGESIGGIAYNHNISVEELLKKNPQARNGVRVGMVLTIPEKSNSSYNTPEQQTVAPVEKIAETQQPVAAEQPAKPTETKPVVEDKPAVKEPIEEEQSPVQELASYTAQTGDTFDKISSLFGISHDKLVELNPFVDPDDIAEGTIIRLSDKAPYYDVPQPKQTVADPIAIEEDEEEEEDEEPWIGFDREMAEITNPMDSINALTDDIIGEMPRSSIVIMLPFMTGGEKPTKRSNQYADFYRGFLIAANEMKYNGEMEVEIIALDTENNPQRLADQLASTADSDIALIIAPEDEQQIQEVTDYASQKGIFVANFFNVKDECYLKSPFSMQGYINQPLMYQKAIQGLMEAYDGYTPVILDPAGQKAEKAPFVASLLQYCDSLGIETIDLAYDGVLNASDLKDDERITDDGKYVFIPKSGSVAVFNSFAPAVHAFANLPENTGKIAVFGYPDWTAFRSDSQEMLQKLEATIYTRFFFNEQSEAAHRLQTQFQQYYGNPMLEAVPSQGALGYDTAKLLIGWIQESNGHLHQMLEGDNLYQGIQSSFRYTHDGQYPGYINDTLYIVKYLPNNNYDIKVL